MTFLEISIQFSRYSYPDNLDIIRRISGIQIVKSQTIQRI